MKDPNETMLFKIHPRTGKYHVPACQYARPEHRGVVLTAEEYDEAWDEQCWICRPKYGVIHVNVWGETNW